MHFVVFGFNMFPLMWHLAQQINCSLPLFRPNDGRGVVVLARLHQQKLEHIEDHCRSLTCKLIHVLTPCEDYLTMFGDLLTHFSPAFVHVSRLVVKAMAPFSVSSRAKTKEHF